MTKTDQDVLELVDDIAEPYEPDEMESQEQSSDTPAVAKFVPFPVDVLPGLLAEYVKQAAESIGCDETMVVNPLLAGIAGAIGNTRQVVLKSDWDEPCILWAMSIAHSGDRKSPPFRKVKAFFNGVEQQSQEAYNDALKEYRKQHAHFKSDLAKWMKKQAGEPPDEPPEPIKERHVIGDTTAEAVPWCLVDNPRGLILMRDELAGWFHSFGQYKNGDADSPFWLECYEAGSYPVDRRGVKKPAHIPRCSVSVTGTIQAGTMRRFLHDRVAVENGMLQRFLLSWPPERQIGWSDAVIDADLMKAVQTMFNDLLALDFYIDSNEKQHPENVYLTPESEMMFIDIANQYAREKTGCHPDLKSYWSKTPGRIARIALLHHLVRCAAGENIHPCQIDTHSMQSAITIGRWYANEASRVYTLLGCGSETGEARERREILDVLRELGGTASISEITVKLSKFRGEEGREKLEKILRQEVSKGRMKSETVNTGGKPKVVFTLLEYVS
jgi:hypothetical protein